MSLGIPHSGRRLLVSGARDLMDSEYPVVSMVLRDVVLKHGWPFVVVHGAAPGADALASKWAYENKIDVEAYGARWGTYGRNAGTMRNAEMLESLTNGDVVVAFPTPGSRGTRHMVGIAQKRGGLHVYTHEMREVV